jgi:hypothetical protein
VYVILGYLCTYFNLFTLEGIMNKLVYDVHKLWKYQRVQFKSENSSSEGHLLLLQLNLLQRDLRV